MIRLAVGMVFALYLGRAGALAEQRFQRLDRAVELRGGCGRCLRILHDSSWSKRRPGPGYVRNSVLKMLLPVAPVLSACAIRSSTCSIAYAMLRPSR